MKVTRKETRERLEQFHLACELVKLIRHFFPDLLPMLKQIPDPGNRSYITYPASVLLMTRILSSVFYISSMRKTSEELNCSASIANIWELCGEEPEKEEELPYWETINRYLARLDPEELGRTVRALCRRLLRSRAFEDARIRGKYWQVILDGTQIHSTTGELDEKCMYRIHKKGTAEEYRENYYYVLEAKLVLHPKILVSIQTEFVENTDGKAMEKQDCERKACWRLMEKLKKEFPRLRICISADSLYGCERFFRECREKNWHYILRFKEGSIPTVAEEYRALKGMEGNRQEKILEDGKEWYDYVTDIDYRGYRVNLAEYGEERKIRIRKGKKKGEWKEKKAEFWFVTDLPLGDKNIREVMERGRMRWKIENEGFNTQKNGGYELEHLFSRNYQALKNHYYLIQIGHMISQVMEAWESMWKKVKQSRKQKHQRILEDFKRIKVKEILKEERIQIRLQ